MITALGLRKRYGRFQALHDVSLQVPGGALVALLGPSGSGKSTLLRIIAGLETADAGSVQLSGAAVDHLGAADRRVGFVFQHYALFRHMSVADNIGFGLEVRGVATAERRRRVSELLALMGLEGLGGRFPAQLSGGQRQRVAVARALAPSPAVLLLDEPFGAVDAKVRTELRRWLRRLHDEVHVTSLFVTHDQDEAFDVADRIVLVNQGRIEQDGAPHEILEAPRSEFVARFFGEVNVWDAVIDAGRATHGGVSVAVDGFGQGARVRLVVRSYDLKLWADPAGPARVRRMVPLGDRVRIEAELPDGGSSLLAHFPRRSSLLRGLEPGGRAAVEVTLARAYGL